MEKCGKTLVNVIRPLGFLGFFLLFVCLFLIKVRLLPSHKDSEIGVLTFLMITSQRDVDSQVLQENIFGLQETNERFISQKGS